MENKEGLKRKGNISKMLAISSDLRGKQSVRATFRITERAISAVSIVSAHLGIKQKTLFDHLIDDVQALCMIADKIELDTFNQLERVQKTYVISRKTLKNLEEISIRFKVPRDALVEYSIHRLLPIIKEEQKKNRKRKRVLNEFSDFMDQWEQLLQKAKGLLGEEDPVYQSVVSVVMAHGNAQEDIRLYVERGKIIEEFQ